MPLDFGWFAAPWGTATETVKLIIGIFRDDLRLEMLKICSKRSAACQPMVSEFLPAAPRLTNPSINVNIQMEAGLRRCFCLCASLVRSLPPALASMTLNPITHLQNPSPPAISVFFDKISEKRRPEINRGA